MLTLDQGTTHAFSVASPYVADEPLLFEIAVASGTTAAPLLELQLGDVVGATGPGGSLVWKADEPALLVGTGTGISPLRAIVLEQLARPESTPITLLFGCRDGNEELWGQELAERARSHARFKLITVQSQPLTGYTGRVGRVQTYLPTLVRDLGAAGRAYLCGHTPMVKDCTALMLEAGIPAERIHGESY
jgi:NAD(P)H-flavin reductase